MVRSERSKTLPRRLPISTSTNRKHLEDITKKLCVPVFRLGPIIVRTAQRARLKGPCADPNYALGSRCPEVLRFVYRVFDHAHPSLPVIFHDGLLVVRPPTNWRIHKNVYDWIFRCREIEIDVTTYAWQGCGRRTISYVLEIINGDVHLVPTFVRPLFDIKRV